MTAVLLEKPGALSAAINSYISGVSYYLRNASEDPDEDLNAAEPMCAARRRLQAWGRPAETQEEAIQALRFALAEAVEYDGSDTIAPMIKAALHVLDRQLADEDDAAQERGEVATRADQNLLSEQKTVGVGDIGLMHNEIHEARQICLPMMLPRLRAASAVQRLGVRLAELIAPELR